MRKRKLTEAEKKRTTQLPDDKDWSWRVKVDVTSFLTAIVDFPAIGVEAGDRFVVNFTTQIFEANLMVYQPTNKKDAYIGFLYDNFGDISAIGTNGMQMRFRKGEIDILGVVVGIIKPFDAAKFSPYEVHKPSELTAVCAKCGKSQTGDKKFLEAEGWELDGKTLCLQCDLGRF